MRNKKWNAESIEYLKINYPNGDLKEIAEKFNVKIENVRSICKKYKIKRSTITSQNLFKLKSLYDDTLNNFYWYGFIMADGHLTNGGELVIKLNIKDINHLSKINKILNVKIHKKEENTPYGLSKQCILRCKDSKYGKLLKNKLNITDKKTINPPNLSFLKTEEMFLCFFAGIIDGDGYIGYRNEKRYMLRILCYNKWVDNLILIKEGLKKYLNIDCKVYINNENFSVLSITKNLDIEILKNYFLKYNLPIMERKWFTSKELRKYKIAKILNYVKK